MGHIAIAEYIIDQRIGDEVWFVVSPQNPLKPKSILADENDRLKMTEIAVAESCYPDKIKACDVEFTMPRPSYTIDTIEKLAAEHSECDFALLLGSDIIGQFEQWRDWQRLISGYKIYVYPRKGYETENADKKFKILNDAPYLDFSSTDVRDGLKKGAAVNNMLPKGVYDYIKIHKLWEQKEV